MKAKAKPTLSQSRTLNHCCTVERRRSPDRGGTSICSACIDTYSICRGGTERLFWRDKQRRAEAEEYSARAWVSQRCVMTEAQQEGFLGRETSGHGEAWDAFGRRCCSASFLGLGGGNIWCWRASRPSCCFGIITDKKERGRRIPIFYERSPAESTKLSKPEVASLLLATLHLYLHT